MWRKIGRLFTIRTRLEAWMVIWAITLGAMERGRNYLEIYHGTLGWVFVCLCMGVVLVAAPKLLDSVRDNGGTRVVLSDKPSRRRRLDGN
jgi:hypothetical protein